MEKIFPPFHIWIQQEAIEIQLVWSRQIYLPTSRGLTYDQRKSTGTQCNAYFWKIWSTMWAKKWQISLIVIIWDNLDSLVDELTQKASMSVIKIPIICVIDFIIIIILIFDTIIVIIVYLWVTGARWTSVWRRSVTHWMLIRRKKETKYRY